MSEKQIHLQRKLERAKLDSLAPLIGSTRAALVMLENGNQVNLTQVRDNIEESYKSLPRREKIVIARDTQQICRSLAPKLNPGFNARPFTHQARRFNLLGRVIKTGIADGNIACSTVDLLLGEKNLFIDSMDLAQKHE